MGAIILVMRLRIDLEHDGEAWLASIEQPGVLGAFAQGKTREEALTKVKAAALDHLGDAVGRGVLPESAVEEIAFVVEAPAA